jgi:membrane protease YdiL (CAAX protease family)
LAILERLSNQWFLIKEKKHLQVWHRVIGIYTFALVVWGFFRLLSPLPIWIEEVFVKAVVFGLPVFLVVLNKEKKDLTSLGISTKNFFESVYLGLSLGAFFWFFGQLSNFIRHKGVLTLREIQPTSPEFGGFLLLALITAWWEELLFMGYILNRLLKVISAEWKVALITSTMFSLVYIPNMIVKGVSIWQMLLQIILLFSLGLGNSILMLRTKNLIAPILSHALWGAMIYMLV